MSDYLIGHIRTYVPLLVGMAITALTDNFGLEIDGVAAEQLAVGLTGVIAAVYYALVRLLAEKWPIVGNFLGVNKAPVYRA